MYYIDAHIYMCTGRKEALARSANFLGNHQDPVHQKIEVGGKMNWDIHVQLRTILASICAYALYTSWKSKTKKMCASAPYMYQSVSR